MRSLKRILLVGGIVAAIAIGVGIGTWLHTGLPGSVPITTWIARQIASVLESYITPKISFASLEYRRPLTVIIRNFALTSEDCPLISADRIVLGLAEIPRQGRPIKIREIDLENPHLAIEFRPDGRLIGWSGFVRPEVMRNPHVVPEGRRFSDVLVLRHVQIRGGEVRYRGPGDPEAMVLPGIEMTLNTLPDEKEPGWYGLVGDLKREPIFNANIDARLNLDTSLLKLKTFTLAAALGEQQYETLPPRLQALLRRHQVRGELAATFAGQVPILDPAQAAGSVAASLKDAYLTVGQAAIGLASLQVSSTLPDGKVSLETGRGTLTQEGHTLAAMEQFRVELPAIPTGKGPVEIDGLDLIRGQAELIADSRGGFVGWSHLGTNENADTTSDVPAGQGQSRGPPTAAPGKFDQGLNQYVRIRHAAIHDSRFVYGLPGGGAPLILDHIDLNLQPGPQGKAEDWQPVTASARTEGLFAAKLTGRFDQASLNLDLDQLKFTSHITGEPQYKLLPEPIESIFREHGVTGDLALQFRGRVPLTSIKQAAGRAAVHLHDAQMHFAAIDLPVGQAQFDFDVPVANIRADLTNLALVSGQTRIIDIRRMRMDLAGPPQTHGPLQIQSATFEHPLLRFILAKDHGFLGWRDLADTEAPWPRLSDFVRFEKMRIAHGEVLLDPTEQDKSDAMILSGIDAQFRTPPVAGSPGWYHLAVAAGKAPLFDAQLEGRINPDAMLLDADSFSLKAELGERQYAAMPPQLQTFLRKHEMQGNVTLTAKGRVPMLDPAQSKLTARMDLRDAHIAFTEVHWPVKRVLVDTRMSGGKITADYDANLLGGKVGGDLRVSLDHPHPLQATWAVDDLHMEDTLRLVQQGPPKYAGLVDSQGSFSANLDGFPATLHGRGTLGVTNGRLIELPVIHDLIRVIRGLTLGIVPKQHDTAKAEFRLCSDRVEVSRLEVNSTAVILRVAGDVHYDQRVDLDVKTRLARKAGQNIGKSIGRIGALGGLSPFRTVSERTGRVLGNGLGEVANALSIGEHILSYRVSGTLSNPRISVQMLARRR